AWPVLALSFTGCERTQPVEPVLEASTTAATGPTVNAPSNIAAAAVDTSQINLSWQDNSTNESGFEVHRSTTGASGAFTLRASLSANTSALSDKGLAKSTQYCYKVRAFQTRGSNTYLSAFSAIACVTTPAPAPPPGPPSNTACTVRLAGPGDVAMVGDDLTWTDNSSFETGYELWYMDDNGGPAYEGLAGRYPANTTSIPGLGSCPLSWCWGWVVMA